MPHFSDLSALVGCWSSVSIRRIIFTNSYLCPFDLGEFRGFSPKVNKTVQLRLQILKFWLLTHTDENGAVLLPHAYRMWNKNSFNKSVVDFILCHVKIWAIFRHFVTCNICYRGQEDWFTYTFNYFICLINNYVVQMGRIDICLERKHRNMILW